MSTIKRTPALSRLIEDRLAIMRDSGPVTGVVVRENSNLVRMNVPGLGNVYLLEGDPNGPQGEQGFPGIEGQQGRPGVRGPKGDQGIRGPVGDRGPGGHDGRDGKLGAQGVRGEKGDRGERGERGSLGATGPGGGGMWIPNPSVRFATLVVAASNASNADKAAADYVCTGVADQVKINEAIAALPSAGGKVLLTEGTFYVATPVDLGQVAGNPNVTLEGSGVWSTIIYQTASMVALIRASISNSRARVRNLTVQGQRGVYASGHGIDTTNLPTLHLFNVLTRSMPEHGFYQSCLALFCEASDCGGWGFYSTLGQELTSCRADNNITGGFYIGGSDTRGGNLEAGNNAIGVEIDNNAGTVFITGLNSSGNTSKALWVRNVTQKITCTGLSISVPNNAKGIVTGELAAGVNTVGVVFSGVNIRGDGLVGNIGVDFDVANYCGLESFTVENLATGVRCNDGNNNRILSGAIAGCTTPVNVVAGTSGPRSPVNWLIDKISIGYTVDSQAANTVFAGPASGANDVPAFRALVAADISHNLFSAVHADTTGTASPVDGDIIIGNVTPKWSKLAISIPAANVLNVLGVANAELRPSWKTVLDGTNPTTIGISDVAAPGTSLVFSHRDHQHGSPATFPATAHNVFSATHDDTTGAASPVDGDIIIGNITPKWSKLAISIPAANVRNVLGIDNAELRPSWKTALDATAPTTIAEGAAAAAGTSLVFSHRDHTHGAPATWAATAHDVLSATHSDILAAAVLRGAIIVGNATPKWSRLTVGAASTVLYSDGTDAAWSAGPQLANILDTGGTTRITTATTAAPGPNVTLTGGVQATATVGIGGAPTSTEILTILTALGNLSASATFLKVQPTTPTVNANNVAVAAIGGIPQVNLGAGFTGVVVKGLDFTVGIGTGTSTTTVAACWLDILFSTTGNATITNLYWLHIDAPTFTSVGASFSVTTTYGIDIANIGNSAKQVDVISLHIADQSTTPTGNQYLMEIGPATPYLRVMAAFTAAANVTPLFISEGATPTLRQLKTVASDGTGHVLPAATLVCILV